jgi:hypothetical protein
MIKDGRERCRGRLPLSFFDLTKKYIAWNRSFILGSLGSERVIEFFLGHRTNNQFDRNAIFKGLCDNGYLPTAQWLYKLGDVNIHADYESAFQWTCKNGHLETAKWLYNLGNIDIEDE